MSDYDGRMGQLAYEDALRFLARRKAEDAALGLAQPKVKAPARTYDARMYPSVWRASRVRDRAHGAAAMPPTPEAAERLANGFVAPTVLVISADGTERVSDLSDFRPERGESKRPSYEAPSAPEHRTTAADLPALMAD